MAKDSLVLSARSYDCQIQRVHCDSSISCTPVKMRSGDSSSRTHLTNLLTTLDSVTGGDESLAQMEVRGDDAPTVVDVHDIARQKEIIHERNNSAVCSSNSVSHRATEIDAKMTARQSAVEHSAAAERAGHRRCSRTNECRGPHRASVMCSSANLSRGRILSVDAGLSCRVERSCKTR